MEMQLTTTLENGLPKPIVKQEMDQSIVMNNESGVFSNQSAENTMDDLKDGSWTCFEGEISDPKQFDPPIQISSNLRKFPPCNISSIEGQVGINEVSIFAKGKVKEIIYNN